MIPPRVVGGLFRIFHWDTFDNETIHVGQAATLARAEAIVHQLYGDRISDSGADRVDIVDAHGAVVKKYSVR